MYFKDFDNSLALVYLPPLSACAVLYDARTIHTHWVSSDHGFFSSYLQHSFGDMSSVYEFRSSFASYAHSLNVSDTSNSIGGQDEIQNGTGTETEKRGRCYNCISDCFYILSLGKTISRIFLIIVLIICFSHFLSISKGIHEHEFSNRPCKLYSTLNFTFSYFPLIFLTLHRSAAVRTYIIKISRYILTEHSRTNIKYNSCFVPL